MSQKSSTFAIVIELERHIEILLLNNDCVIVPDLGGFMTHHCEAHFDDEDCLFLPPLRTLGFNPQLKMNDSLLAQSYIEAYDISYPEAIRRIEAEVAELKQHLNTEGYYEMNDLGMLSVNEEGKLEFEPCEAGILTPALYGLSSFEMTPLHEAKPTAKLSDSNKVIEERSADDVAEETEIEEALIIRMSWVRNAVAVAAALVAFFMVAPHVDNSEQTKVSMSQMNLPIIIKDTSVNFTTKLDTQSIKEDLSKEDTTAINSTNVAPAEEELTAAAPQVAQELQQLQPSAVYCIVVASQVSQRNAEAFVKELQQKGIEDVRVYVHNNIRRVICGSYTTEAEAYRQLQNVHQHEKLGDAWVYKMTN